MNQNIPDEVMQQMKQERKLLGGIIKYGDPFYKNAIKFILMILLLPILIVYLVVEFLYNSTDEIKNILWKIVEQVMMIPSYVFKLLVHLTQILKRVLNFIQSLIIRIGAFIWKKLYILKLLWNKIYLIVQLIVGIVSIFIKFIYNQTTKIFIIIYKILAKIYDVSKSTAEFVIQKIYQGIQYCIEKALLISDKLFDLFINISIGLKLILQQVFKWITIGFQNTVILICNFYEAVINISEIVIRFFIKIVSKLYKYFVNYVYKPIKYVFQKLWNGAVKLSMILKTMLLKLFNEIVSFISYVYELIKIINKKLIKLVQATIIKIVEITFYILGKLLDGYDYLCELYNNHIKQPIKTLIRSIWNLIQKLYKVVVYSYNSTKTLLLKTCTFVISKIKNLVLIVYNNLAYIVNLCFQTVWSLIKQLYGAIRRRMLLNQKRFRKIMKLIISKVYLLVESFSKQIQRMVAKAFSLIYKGYSITSNYIIAQLTILGLFFKRQLILGKHLVFRGLKKLLKMMIQLLKFTLRQIYLGIFMILFRILRLYACFSVLLDGVVFVVSSVNHTLDSYGATLALSLVSGFIICVEYFFKKIKYVGTRVYSFLKSLFQFLIKILKYGISLIRWVITTIKIILLEVKKVIKKTYTLLKGQLIRLFKFTIPRLMNLIQILFTFIKKIAKVLISFLKKLTLKSIKILKIMKQNMIMVINIAKNLIKAIIIPVKEVIVSLLIILKNFLIQLKNIVIQYFTSMKNFCKTILLEILQSLVSIQQQVYIFAKRTLVQLKDIVLTQSKALGNAMKGYLNEVVKALIEIKNSLVQQSKSFKAQMIDFKNSLIQMGVQLKTSFIELKNSLITFVKQLRQSLKQQRN